MTTTLQDVIPTVQKMKELSDWATLTPLLHFVTPDGERDIVMHLGMSEATPIERAVQAIFAAASAEGAPLDLSRAEAVVFIADSRATIHEKDGGGTSKVDAVLLTLTRRDGTSDSAFLPYDPARGIWLEPLDTFGGVLGGEVHDALVDGMAGLGGSP